MLPACVTVKVLVSHPVIVTVPVLLLVLPLALTETVTVLPLTLVEIQPLLSLTVNGSSEVTVKVVLPAAFENE